MRDAVENLLRSVLVQQNAERMDRIGQIHAQRLLGVELAGFVDEVTLYSGWMFSVLMMRLNNA